MLALLLSLLVVRHPLQTLLIITTLVGSWWVVRGVLDLIGGVSGRTENRGWSLLWGLISVVAAFAAAKGGAAGAGVVFVVLVLIAANVWVHVGARAAQLVTGPVAALILVATGRVSGLSWAQLGLDPRDAPRGLAVGVVAAMAVALVYAGLLAVPKARGILLDVRYAGRTRTALREAVVTIPLATVVFEEAAFRGVLWGSSSGTAAPPSPLSSRQCSSASGTSYRRWILSVRAR